MCLLSQFIGKQLISSFALYGAFSVVKIKFKMQFCNLDDLGLSTLTYSNTSYVSFNFPFVHFVQFGQLDYRYIGPFFYILINLGRFNAFEKFKSIELPQFRLTLFHSGWFGVISLDFAPYCLILINWDLVTQINFPPIR